jgi:hypothetical protein
LEILAVAKIRQLTEAHTIANVQPIVVEQFGGVLDNNQIATLYESTRTLPVKVTPSKSEYVAVDLLRPLRLDCAYLGTFEGVRTPMYKYKFNTGSIQLLSHFFKKRKAVVGHKLLYENYSTH